MGYNLELAERLHNDKATYSMNLEVSVFHYNMVNAIRLERFRKYPQKFGRLESIQMNEIKQRLIASGDL
jgi:hypothetical protein